MCVDADDALIAEQILASSTMGISKLELRLFAVQIRLRDIKDAFDMSVLTSDVAKVQLSVLFRLLLELGSDLGVTREELVKLLHSLERQYGMSGQSRVTAVA